MNVIFLDIDGVLTTARTSIAYNEACIKTLDPVSVKMIASICRQSNMKICICSNWRIEYPVRSEFVTNFAYYGGGPLIPYMLKGDDWRTPILGDIQDKNAEIREWLTHHQEVGVKLVISPENISDFQACSVQTLSFDGYSFQNYLDTIKIIEERALQYGRNELQLTPI